jgi:LacI family transcriptional regulator
VILCNSSDDAARQTRHLELLEEQRVQGILLTPVDAADEQIRALQARGTPVILVDSRSADGRQCSVAVDDVRGGDLAVSHLLQAGHQRIGYVGGPSSIRQVADRRDGAVHALGRTGPPGCSAPTTCWPSGCSRS